MPYPQKYPTLPLPFMALPVTELNHKLHHVLQCAGYCFSRAYPTPPSVMDSMISPKNITSEALCCVASNWTQVRVHTVSCHW
uniref:Glycoprotein hormones alpha chain n=1 Tax=Eptatretus burgeri TaxID=7764 RepID=A0A8C4QMH0_EPTBU